MYCGTFYERTTRAISRICAIGLQLRDAAPRRIEVLAAEAAEHDVRPSDVDVEREIWLLRKRVFALPPPLHVIVAVMPVCLRATKPSHAEAKPRRLFLLGLKNV